MIPHKYLFALLFFVIPIVLPAQPTNDQCIGAIELQVYNGCSSENGSSGAATQSLPAISCNGFVGDADDDMWYYFVATADTARVEVTEVSNYDAVIEFFTGTCGSLSSFACSDVTSGGVEATTLVGLTIGDTIWIRTYDFAVGGGSFSICVRATPSGNNCNEAIIITQVDTIISDTYFNGNNATSYSCVPNNYSGNDRYYSIYVSDPDVTTVRVIIDSVEDANDNILFVSMNGSTCSEGQCSSDAGVRFNIANQLFEHNNLNSMDFAVNGEGYYYLTFDSDVDSIDYMQVHLSYISSGIRLDTSGCGLDNDNDGIHFTWMGSQLTSVDPGDSGTLCMTYYVTNPGGWEWLKYVDVELGDCWQNMTNLTPDDPPGGNGFYDIYGDWSGSVNSNEVNWEYTNGDPSGDPSWGDGRINISYNYNCYEYQFCFDAEIDSNCADSLGTEIYYSLTDDGVGINGVSVASNLLGRMYFLLPVEYGEWYGYAEGMKNELRWTTLSESNSDYFEVQRSHDGLQFQTIGRVEAAGLSDQEIKYAYTDRILAQESYYYRLHQIDKNGLSHRSSLIYIKRSTKYRSLHVSPNPASNWVAVKIPDGGNRIDVLNNAGQLLLQEIGPFTSNPKQINISFLPKGVYYLRVQTNHDIYVGKIVKL